MVNLYFQQPSLQSSVSHDYPEIILIYGFGSQILLSSLLKMVVLLNILWMYTLFFLVFFEYKVQKNSVYVKQKSSVKL